MSWSLRDVTLANGTQVSYVIDATGRRVGRKVNGVFTQKWLYQDSLKPIAELNAAGAVVSRFIYAGKANVPEYLVRGGITYRLITDHLGSVRLVVNASSGTIAQQMDYDEFGRVLADTNPGFQPFGYAGGLYDPLTGLVRFGARDYDAESGRWTSKDPIGFGGGMNHYLYVGNNPVSLTDYLGLCEDMLWYDRLGSSMQNNGEVSKGFLNDNLPWWLAGIADTVIDLGTGLTSIPSSIGHLGEGTGKFSADPTLENSAGVFADISVAANVMAAGLAPTPIGNAKVGWKGGEVTFTRPGAATPDFRFNPKGNWKNPSKPCECLPHYHRRPGIGKHRPWERGF